MTPPHSGPRLRNGLTPLAKALALALGITCTSLTTTAAVPVQGQSHLRQHRQHMQQAIALLRQRFDQNPRAADRFQRLHTRHALASAPAGVAATQAVTSCVDDATSLTTPGTLRYEVVNANNGDTIDLSGLACSTVTLTQGELPVSVANLTIMGPSSGTFTIDANYRSRVFDHTSNGTLTLQNLTLRNGYAYYAPNLNSPAPSPSATQATYGGVGGCVYSAGELNVDHSVITGCYAYAPNAYGGAVFAQVLYMQSSTISNSSAVATGAFSIGGGADVLAYSVLLNSQISGNTAVGYAVFGGGLYSKYGAYIAGSTISANTGSGYGYGYGGGLATKYGTSLLASTVSGNVAEVTNPSNSVDYGTGGGVFVGYNYYTHGSLSNVGYSTVDSNRAGFGAGIYTKYDARIVQSTISGNSASVVGGGLGMFAKYGARALTLANSTVARNSAQNIGGGLLLGYDRRDASLAVTLQSNLIADNTAGIYGGDIYGQYYSVAPVPNGSTAPQPSAVTISGANNLVIDAYNVTLPGDTLSADPILQPLANNGGPTRTHGLGPGSPAIDAGNNTSGFQYDQRGPGYARVGGVAADIGAVEANVAAAEPVNVPALSAWAAGLLASLLGWLGLRRRRRDTT